MRDTLLTLVELSVVEQRYQAVLAGIRDGVPAVEVAGSLDPFPGHHSQPRIRLRNRLLAPLILAGQGPYDWNYRVHHCYRMHA